MVYFQIYPWVVGFWMEIITLAVIALPKGQRVREYSCIVQTLDSIFLAKILKMCFHILYRGPYMKCRERVTKSEFAPNYEYYSRF